MKKRLISYLKLFIGLSLIFFIFSRIEWYEFINTIKRINPVYIYISTILFFFPGIWLSVLKWKKLLLIHNIDLPFKQLYLYYLMGTFFNNFLPSAIGGDIIRVFYLKRATNKFAEITSSIIMERLTGLLALIFIFAFSVILNLSFIYQIPYINYIIISIVFTLTIMFFLLNNGGINKIISKFKFLTPLIKKIIELSEALFNYRYHKKVLVLTFIISIIFVLFGVFATYIYFLAIGIKIPILRLILIYTIIQLIGILPISINSLGVSEGAFIILYGLIGISSVDSLTVALLGRILMMVVSLSGGVVYIFRNSLIR